MVLKRFAMEGEISPGEDSAMVLISSDGALEEALRFCCRLRSRLPPSKLQILACASASPDKQSWSRYLDAGVNFLLLADFSYSDMELRLIAAECYLKPASPSRGVLPAPVHVADFTPDTALVPYGEFYSSLDGKFLKVNAGLVKILGYSSKEELLRLDMNRDVYFDPAERARLIAIIPSQNIAFEVVWKRRDGTPVTLQLSGHVFLDEAQSTICFKGIVWDITEQKQIQEMLRMQRDLGIALSRSTRSARCSTSCWMP